MAHKKESFVLPSIVSGPVELNLLIKELNEADDALHQGSLRKGGEETKLPPRLSRLLSDTTEVNELNLLHQTDRDTLKTKLTELKDKAPVMHMSFNADPSPAFMGKLTMWVRENIHPYALIRVGLLPNIGAGCVLRTSNQVFDFSLRTQFDKSQNILIDNIKMLSGAAK